MGVVVVKKSGGDGHCGRHMHSNLVKEVSRVKKTKTENLQEAQDDMSQASCIVGCYSSNGGG